MQMSKTSEAEQAYFQVSSHMLFSFLLSAAAWTIAIARWLDQWIMQPVGVGQRGWLLLAISLVLTIYAFVIGKQHSRHIWSETAKGKRMRIGLWQSLMVIIVLILTAAIVLVNSAWIELLDQQAR